mmetsp:Transcript_14161/g.20676  ORF Transcript_14161/g.20676 Transcript_14161/m.20676 type:complete len:488 (+) Transcript_14161:4829-6292(+)
MRCSCHRAKCTTCLKCSGCECKCPPVQRKKRSRRFGPNYCENEAEDTNPKEFYSPQCLDLPIDSIAKIRKAFEIDENVGRGMPSLTNRKEKEMSEFDDESASRMVNFAMQSFNALCQVIYPKDPKALALKSSLKVLNHGTGDEDSKLRENARSISMTLPPKSLQRRAILAIIASSYSSNVLRTEFRLGKQLIAEARKEFKFMEQGNVLQQSVRYVESYDKFAVERAVRFILNDANVQRISWGTKKVIIQGEEVDFPKLVRKRVIEYILRGYNEYYLEREDRIGNSSFKKICKVLTSTDAKAKNAVDYVSGRLMYDNFDLIRRIVATHDIELTKLANGLEAFLKSTFEAHIGKCPVSKRNFAFARKGSSTGTCEVCEVPERVMRYFKSWIDPMHASLLDDCTHKIHLYRGHRIRVRNQREAIDELLDGLLLNQALIVKPADAWKLFQEKHPAPESESTCYPPMSKIKSKISALKAAYKKSNCLPIIPE